ncbi:MAG: protein kinase [Polyangiaceae bacterium]|nr:protein kinase [Polyangiaceae bacterium]
MHSHEIHPGDVLAGKYRVRAILGRNHGLLVDAFHTEFDQRVVIKVLLPGAGDSKEIERFRREARTLAKLSSEHVARIIDVGSENDGTFYLVREYLEGTDMARYLRTSGPLALADAVLLVLQAAEAVAETHSHGIIVREIQPSTLFLTQRAGGAPLVKVIDFGTAKLMNAAAAPGVGAELTATAMFGLSPYSSPEMIRKAKSADGRTDVWSLGAILYELVTGHAPFRGEAAMLMLQITREEPTPPSHLAPHLPADLDQVISWALAKDVDARFKNVYAFAHALRPFAPPEGQLLVDRIGQITEAAKRKPKAASLPPPSAPPARGSQPAPPARSSGPGSMRLHEESFTREFVPQPRGSSNNAVSHEVEDTTARVGNGFNAPQPNVPTIPPPRPSGSNSVPAPALSAPKVPAASVPPPASGGGMSTSVPQPRGSQPGYSTPELQTGPSASYPAAPANKPGIDRRILVGAVAAVAVLLPAMVAIFVMSRSRPNDVETANTGAVTIPLPASAVTAEPAISSAPATTSEAPATTSAPVTSATTSSEPAPPATQEPVASNGTKKAVTSGGSGNTTPTPKPTANDPPPKTTTTKTADPPPSSGSDKGTLMAVALGGTCAFSVNGSSKGSGSSIRVQLSPGTYSVMCKPPGGGVKSKSVTVKKGETAMTTFKL